MAETETETSGHTHTDVHDACSIHAALAANHRVQVIYFRAILVALAVIFIFASVSPANRAAQGKTVPGAVSVSTPAGACTEVEFAAYGPRMCGPAPDAGLAALPDLECWPLEPFCAPAPRVPWPPVATACSRVAAGCVTTSVGGNPAPIAGVMTGAGGSGGVVAIGFVPLQRTITGHGGNTAPVDSVPTSTGGSGSGSGMDAR